MHKIQKKAQKSMIGLLQGTETQFVCFTILNNQLFRIINTSDMNLCAISVSIYQFVNDVNSQKDFG